MNGVSGSALVFDGYTSVITRDADRAPRLQEEFTIDAWLAVAAYPWNYVPIISHSDEKLHGCALEITNQILTASGCAGICRISLQLHNLDVSEFS